MTMMRRLIIVLVTAVLALNVVLVSGCANNAQTGAAIGGTGGVVIGAATGGFGGAVLGGCIGAGAGYIIGNEQDK